MSDDGRAAALPAQGGDDWPWLRDLLTEMSSVASGITPNVPSAQRVLAAVPEEYRVAAGLPYDPSFDDSAPCCLPGEDCPHVNSEPKETPMTVTDEKSEGLLPKYHVERNSDPEGKHAGCRYFVLDPLHDPIARSVLATYGALARAEGYDALADDLRDWLRSLPEPGERRG